MKKSYLNSNNIYIYSTRKEAYNIESLMYGSPIRDRGIVTNIRITHESHQKPTKGFFPKTMFLVQRPHSDVVSNEWWGVYLISSFLSTCHHSFDDLAKSCKLFFSLSECSTSDSGIKGKKDS